MHLDEVHEDFRLLTWTRHAILKGEGTFDFCRQSWFDFDFCFCVPRTYLFRRLDWEAILLFLIVVDESFFFLFNFSCWKNGCHESCKIIRADTLPACVDAGLLRFATSWSLLIRYCHINRTLSTRFSFYVLCQSGFLYTTLAPFPCCSWTILFVSPCSASDIWSVSGNHPSCCYFLLFSFSFWSFPPCHDDLVQRACKSFLRSLAQL